MPLETVRKHTAEVIANTLESELGHRPESVVLEVPPRRELGDLAWPGALPLAKVLKRAPRQIAEALVAKAEWHHLVDRVEVAGPGFLNLFLDRSAVLRELLAGSGKPRTTSLRKSIVEHTNINPNKAAHIGHLRNAVLGDTLVRCLRHAGNQVEVQNYIDDTGVQVADVVVGILFLPEPELAAALGVETVRRTELIETFVDRIPREGAPQPAVDDFDDLCWQIYPQVTARYESDPELAGRRPEVLHAIEEGSDDLPPDQAIQLLTGAVIAGDSYPPRAVAFLAAAVAEGNVRCHLATMARLGVAYDVLPHESDILHRGFWLRAFDLLKKAGAIRFEEEGKNAGCWVMSLADSAEFADMDDPDKILVRSNGTVTYTGKDIAYQLWKLGLLVDEDGSRHDFGYLPMVNWSQSGAAAPVQYSSSGEILARTTANPQEQLAGLSFGAADQVYNVIDVRQSYPQKVVKEAVRVLGHPEAADSSVHFSYEMVALTPAAVQLIEQRTGASFGLSEEDMQKAYVEMSGRRGIGVKADEFLDTLVATAAEAVRKRAQSKDLEAPDDIEQRAEAIAVGALRYLMARQSRNRVLAFDFDEALAFEGDTGPYLQYSAVRAAKIFEKLAVRRGEGMIRSDELELLAGAKLDDELWSLVLECGRRQETVAGAVAKLEFSLLAQHVHGLAQLFHKLYNLHPVVPEEDESLRRLRRAVFTVFNREIKILLEELLGIPIPEEM
jgi:arginyl-tRNA synthetase